MLARPIIAISPDRALGLELAAALSACGPVAVCSTVDAAGAQAPEAALCVIHVGDELARAPGELLSRLPGSCPVIAVSPRASLAAVVELMQASPRVAAVLIAEQLDSHQLAALAARIVRDDLFGLDQAMPPGTQIQVQAVGDYQDKLRCMAQVAELVERAGAPRHRRDSIEQCLDEMLMNALYDAPVDAQGQHIFAGVPTRSRVTLRTEHSVTVQYACDGRQLAIAVRDAFGTLDRQTVLRHLHKGLHAAQQVDRKVGGAGLGLYLMASASTAVSFHVLPGIATEAVCVFDLQAPRLALERLAFLVQLDPAGQQPSGPARALPAARPSRARLRAWLLTAALSAIVASIAVLVVARTTGGGEPGGEAPVATVELDSRPTGAEVELDGEPAGSTPLTLTHLVPGQTVSIVFRRTGYRAATARLEVPEAGQRKQLVQPLELSDDFVRVRLVSEPPGAEVVRTGQPSTTDRTYTPAEVFVEADRPHSFTLVMPKHVPLVIGPFTPARGTRGLEKGGTLVQGATLRIEGPAGGKVTVSGAPHCKEVALPIGCTLAPGTYTVEHTGRDGARSTRKVIMGTDDDLLRFAGP